MKKAVVLKRGVNREGVVREDRRVREGKEERVETDGMKNSGNADD